MNHPWQRNEGEGTQAFDAFLYYLYLDPRERTIDRAYNDVMQPKGNKRASGRWTAWSSQYKWLERATAFDDYLAAIQFVNAQELAMAQAKIRALERDKITTLERELAESLVERAREMLKQPIVRKVANKDGEGFTIEPVKWTARDIVQHIEAADKLFRLSAGMHTDATRVDISQVLGDATNYVLDVASKILPTEWYDNLELALSK